jgi:hypothetical protein
MFDLVEYRSLAFEFMKEKNRALFDYHSGINAKANLEPVYKKYGSRLFSNRVVEEIIRAVASAESGDIRRLKWFAGFAFDENFATKTLFIDEEIASEKADADYDYNQAQIRRSDSSLEAAVIYEKLKQHKMKTRDLYVKRLRIQRESFKWINSESHLCDDCDGDKSTSPIGGRFLSDELGQSLSILEIQLKQFITASGDYYMAHLQKFSKNFLSCSVDAIEPWDIPILLRGKKFDSLFTDWSPISLVKRTLMGLGVDLKKMDNIFIDTVKRRGKSVTPYCSRIAVPDEIGVSLYPVGGVADVLNLFHLLGEALQSAHVSSEQSFEFSSLGDGAIWSTCGFLFQYLLLNREWLKDYLRLENSDEFRDFIHFRKLYLLRSEAVNFLSGLEYVRGNVKDEDDLATEVARLKQEVLGHKYDREFAFSSFKSHFGTTDYLRGWIFEAELREILVSRFGERWYSRPGAGDFLKELWSYGQRFTAPELAAKIRLLELDILPLRRELE